MIDFGILESRGVTNERLKKIFTAMPDHRESPVPGESKQEKRDRIERNRQLDLDLQIRERFRREEQTRVEEGIVSRLRDWKLYATCDLAWDSSVISKTTLPLQMYAQGKISVERAAKLLSQVENGKQYIKEEEPGKYTVDVPRFIETNINLVRSIIGRRHAAQKNKFNQLWPYYKYEPRSTGLPAKCRADVLSQRVDIMCDQFDYRHHDSQVMRDGFLYGHSLDFVRASWEVEEQWRRKDINGDPKDVESYITKEGVGWFNPHPSRLFWDNSSPISSINTDTGCNWVGFWDVMRYSQIDDNPAYFNKASVGWTGRFWGEAGVYNTYKDYFTHYQYTIIPPEMGEIDPAKANDRKAIVGFYSGNQRDASVFVANYFRKIVPKDWGMGDYPFPIWIRFVCASDATVIFAEIMPSTPAAYLGINENDSRQVNVSMAMDLFAYQDQMTNLATHLMLLCQIEIFKVIGLNKDMIDPDQLKIARAHLKGKNWFSEPLILEYSMAKLMELGIKPEQVVQIVETKVSGSINAIFEAMIKLVTLVERMMALSPAEQGQPAPREISATEVNEISNTTSSIYSSISEDIDEYRAAKKRIVYESLVTCSRGQVECPVKDRYTPKTIIAAGFQAKQGEDEDYNDQTKGKPRRMTVIGSPKALVHDYIFTSRDGSERPVNTQAANTLVQLIGQVLSVPVMAQAMGKEKLYELFNEVFRLSGAGVDLNLTLKEGEDDSMGASDIDQLKQTLQQVIQNLNQMAGQLQKNAQDIQQIEQVDQHQEQSIESLGRLADQVKTIAGQIDKMHQEKNGTTAKLVESMSYKDVPDEIKRQIELQAGFEPAFGSPTPDDKKLATQKEIAVSKSSKLTA